METPPGVKEPKPWLPLPRACEAVVLSAPPPLALPLDSNCRRSWEGHACPERCTPVHAPSPLQRPCACFLSWCLTKSISSVVAIPWRPSCFFLCQEGERGKERRGNSRRWRVTAHSCSPEYGAHQR